MLCCWPAALECAVKPLESTTWQACLAVTTDRCNGNPAKLRRLGWDGSSTPTRIRRLRVHLAATPWTYRLLRMERGQNTAMGLTGTPVRPWMRGGATVSRKL